MTAKQSVLPASPHIDTHGAVLIDLSVAIIAIINDTVSCRIVPGTPPRLPSGPFFPPTHRTMEIGLRQSVDEQIGVVLGHVEQLYTFGDQGRVHDDEPVVSVGYLALTESPNISGTWCSLYDFFPWENWRNGRPACLDKVILPALQKWAEAPATRGRSERIKIAFGTEKIVWDEERSLDRYELLYEARLVPEAKTDQQAHHDIPNVEGMALQLDHRRILATALGRLRGKMKYRPVIFNLMPNQFTLTQLQNVAETVLGVGLHKQNFRRIVQRNEFVEPIGTKTNDRKYQYAKGRPAKLYRAREQSETARTLPGLRLTPHR